MGYQLLICVSKQNNEKLLYKEGENKQMAGFNIFRKTEQRAIQTKSTVQFNNASDVIEAAEYSSLEAIENADVYTAIHTIASDVSSLPLRVTNDSYNSNPELEYMLNIEPNLVMNGKSLIYILIANSILNGNAYAQIERDSNGIPVALHHITNDRVLNIKKYSNKNHNIKLIYEVKYLDKSGTKEIDSQDILHIKPFSLTGFQGMSPLTALATDLDIQKNSKNFFSNFFKNGTMTGAVITKQGDLNPEQLAEFAKNWSERNSGVKNAHKTIVLDESTKYEPIKVDTEILKLVNSSNSSTLAVAKVLGLPLHKLKIETHSMSLEEANNDYLINTLNSYISEIESELNRKLFVDRDARQTHKITLDISAYKYADSKTKIETVKAKYEMGLISNEEARGELDYAPTGNTPRFIQSLNYMNSELIDNYQMEKVKQVQKNVVDEEPLEGGEI